MATIHGKGGMVYLHAAAASPAKWGEARTWRINIDRAMDEDNALGDTWRTQLAGLLSWSGSIEANVDTADANPFTAATATSAWFMEIYPVASVTARFYSGQIWPKLSVEGGIAGVSRATLDFDGEGTLSAT